MTNELTFTVIAPRVQNSVVTYSFSLDGKLTRAAFNTDAADHFKKASLDEAPISITYKKGEIPAEFLNMQKAGCLIRDISEFDFTYESFARIYAYRVGDLKKQRKLLEALTFEERILAFAFIPRYKAYLNRTGVAQLYPERYLLQRRWENVLPS